MALPHRYRGIDTATTGGDLRITVVNTGTAPAAFYHNGQTLVIGPDTSYVLPHFWPAAAFETPKAIEKPKKIKLKKPPPAVPWYRRFEKRR